MAYGEEKARDMARSLLPSRWRKGARKERAHIHRGSRREPKAALARLVSEPEGWDEQPFPKDTSQRELRWVVWHRRGADKVNPFIRWATAVTRELPRESRLSHVRGRVPQGVIGEHALEHLKHTEAFESPVERARRQAWWWRVRSKTSWMERGELAQLLRQVLQVPEGHRTFNRWLRYHPNATYLRWGNKVIWAKEVRALLGVHDVLPFLDSVGGSHQAMVRFLSAFKQCRGDVPATLRALGVRPGGRNEPYFVKIPAHAPCPGERS